MNEKIYYACVKRFVTSVIWKVLHKYIFCPFPLKMNVPIVFCFFSEWILSKKQLTWQTIVDRGFSLWAQNIEDFTVYALSGNADVRFSYD